MFLLNLLQTNWLGTFGIQLMNFGAHRAIKMHILQNLVLCVTSSHLESKVYLGFLEPF